MAKKLKVVEGFELSENLQEAICFIAETESNDKTDSALVALIFAARIILKREGFEVPMEV